MFPFTLLYLIARFKGEATISQILYFLQEQNFKIQLAKLSFPLISKLNIFMFTNIARRI
jgi:hypothetical protein